MSKIDDLEREMNTRQELQIFLDQMETHKQVIATMAKMTREHYVALLREDFTEEQALVLTASYMQSLTGRGK